MCSAQKQPASRAAFLQSAGRGTAFLTFDFGVDGVSIEIAKYARILEKLADKELEIDMCEHNYELASRYFSYAVLRNKLRMLIDNAFGTNNY